MREHHLVYGYVHVNSHGKATWRDAI